MFSLLLATWVKVQKIENTEISSWGPGGRRAPGGSRATPWQGVQGAGGPRKLLDFSISECNLRPVNILKH